ncbi:MAG TPA: hypothetical protein PKD86_12485 [Gemmatales bacterium]|nr:hypothetical protein [Gemmatales bacterium]HMP60159.1 hypothetical protein [Gemmatales bacterium]
MAKCETGYLCDVCGQEVEAIVDSDLYLRYVLGEVGPEELPRGRERHIRCNPTLAQFIVDERFVPVSCPEPFGKEGLDTDWVRAEEARVSRGWRRLQEVPMLGVSVAEYPLAEVRARWAGG